MQRFAGERTLGDDALIGAVVDDFPAFGVTVAVADGLAQHGAQAAAAPDVLFEKRSESKWFEQHTCSLIIVIRGRVARCGAARVVGVWRGLIMIE